METAQFAIWRGDRDGGDLVEYETEVAPGMVVLDAVRQIQAESAPDLAVRWNCKAGKCGSCSAEVNGRPRLMCMARLNGAEKNGPIRVEPLRAFPVVRDLVTDVSWNFEAKKAVRRFTPVDPEGSDGTWRLAQEDVERAQEFRKCIECFLCQDVCHVLRDHHLHGEYGGPRLEQLREEFGIGYCNITKCCTKVCPEEIAITDNSIIPLKERIVDEYYDPVKRLLRRLLGSR